MSKGSNRTPATQTVVQSSQLPAWVDSAAQNNLALANQIAAQPQVDYTGQRLAGFDQNMLNAQQGVRDLQGTGAAAMAPAMATARDVADNGYAPVQAQNFLSGNLQGYMNPYLDQVETGALGAIERQRAQAINQTGDQALSRGAFGGSRHGVVEAVTNAEAARMAGETSANIRSQGFNAATGLMTGDMERAFRADVANQQAGQTQDRNALTAAQLQGQLATQGRTMTAQELALLETVGRQNQGQQQAGLDIAYQDFQNDRAYPIDMLNLRTAALTQSPYGRTNTTTTPVTSQNTALGVLGGASTGASIASSLNLTGSLGGWGGTLAAGVGGLLGGLSEDDEKTDVKKVGKDPETGVPLVADRYKGDPKTYPQVVGPMASDMQKAAPSQVKRLGKGGPRIVNLGFGPMKRAFA
jgi:hypothetical protein